MVDLRALRELRRVEPSLNRRDIRTPLQRAAMDAFREGDPPPAREMKEVMNFLRDEDGGFLQEGWMGPAELDGHHVVVKEHLKEMVALRRYQRPTRLLTPEEKSIVDTEWERIKDLGPAFPFDRQMHSRYHQIFDKLMAEAPPQDATQYAARMRRALEDLRDECQDETIDFDIIWQRAEEWLRSSDIDILP